jgi:hypothetical protein
VGFLGNEQRARAGSARELLPAEGVVSAIPPALRTRTCAQRTLSAIYAQEARRQAGAGAYGRMINNADDMLDYEDGTVDGVRFTNPSRFSRLRGGAW